jgi:hypothetical protein
MSQEEYELMVDACKKQMYNDNRREFQLIDYEILSTRKHKKIQSMKNDQRLANKIKEGLCGFAKENARKTSLSLLKRTGIIDDNTEVIDLKPEEFNAKFGSAPLAEGSFNPYELIH